MKHSIFGFVGLVMALAAPLTAAGAIVAVSPSGGMPGFGDKTFGWRFQVLQEITVVKLGACDKDGNGLPAAVDVGLWKDDGTSLSSVTLPAGTTAELNNSFRYASIPHLTLLAGSYYRVGSVVQSGVIDLFHETTFVTPAPQISFAGGYYNNSQNSLTFPDTSGTQNSYFGPNFQFEVIPEPSSFVLAVLALLGLGWYAWRRKR